MAGWNYQYLDKLNAQKHITVLDLTEKLWESFFDDGSSVPLTLAVLNLTKVPGFVKAVDALGLKLVSELGTAGVVQGFLQAADSAYRFNRHYVDFGHFLSLLIDKLPRSGYALTSYDELLTLINAAKAQQQNIIVHERHSDDVPDATGLNIFLPATDAQWAKRSKLYSQLYGYQDWNFLVGYIYGRRSGDITDSFLASDSLNWKSAIATIESDDNGVAVSRYLSEVSKPNAVAVTLRYGVRYGGDTEFWVGEVPAELDKVSGRVLGRWDWRMLTVGAGDNQCAIFHTLRGETVVFDVMFYKPGSAPYRAIGVYSIKSGKWSLYTQGDDGVAEIVKGPAVTWIVPMIQDLDGRLVETVVAECKQSLFYTT